ncbi:MAG: hypothetical protein LOD92_08590, partial [Bacillales bacterium]
MLPFKVRGCPSPASEMIISGIIWFKINTRVEKCMQIPPFIHSKLIFLRPFFIRLSLDKRVFNNTFSEKTKSPAFPKRRVNVFEYYFFSEPAVSA